MTTTGTSGGPHLPVVAADAPLVELDVAPAVDAAVLDDARLAAVRATGLLDSAATASFDALTALAARLLNAPISFLTVVDERRSYWASCTGVDATTPAERQNPVEQSFCQYVIADAAPVVVEDAAQHPRTRDNPSVALLGVRAWAGFPVRGPQGHVLGSFCVVDVVPRRWSDEEVATLDVLAQAASAQVGLLAAADAERAAHEVARRLGAAEQQARERLSRLASVAFELAGAQTLEDLTAAVVTRGLAVLGADGGAVAVRDDEAGLLRVAVDVALGEDVQVAYGELPLDSPLPAAHVARTGEPVLLPDRTSGLAWSPSMQAVYDATQRSAWATLPLVAGGRLLGALVVAWADERELTEAELELIVGFAAQCAQALDRIQSQAAQQRLMAASQRMSEALQLALLTRAPDPRDLEIAVRYRPANEAAQIGGDWYDAFVTRTGIPTVIVGDVNGHNQEAASSMGQLRNILRGMAYDSEDGPSLLLHRLDHALRGLDLDTLATAVIAQLEDCGDGCRLRWSSAGHLPPLLVGPDGEVVPLEGSDLMLGVDPELPRTEQVRHVPPGSTLVLYTDGLVERRAASIDDGIAWLAGVLRDLRHEPPEALCDALLGATVTGATEDDVALLVLRLPPPADADAPAGC